MKEVSGDVKVKSFVVIKKSRQMLWCWNFVLLTMEVCFGEIFESVRVLDFFLLTMEVFLGGYLSQFIGR